MKIFITGERGVGKSTLIEKLLKESGLSYSGVKTFSVADSDNGKTVFICPVKETVPFAEMKAGRRENRKNVEEHPEVFNEFGVRLLSKEADLTVIDEIGNLENGAADYISLVESLLENPKVNIMGVIQKDAEGHLADVVKKKAEIIELTEENRDSVLFLLRSRLS